MNVRALAQALLAVVGVAGTCVSQQHIYLGRVIDDRGEEVAGAAVTARWCGAPELPDLVGWTLGAPDELGCRSAVEQSDDAGRFRIELPVRGPVALIARDATGERQSLRCFPVMAGSFSELRLRTADFVGGRVVTGDGAPLADRELVLEPKRNSWARRAVNSCPITRVRLRTDASGRFRHALEHAWFEAPMWEPSIVLRPADDELGFAREVIVRPLTEMTELELVATPRVVWRGSLRDIAGIPLVGGRVYERHAPWRSVQTGEEGAFAIPATKLEDLGFVADGHSPSPKRTQPGRPEVQDDHGAHLIPCKQVTMRLVDEPGAPLAEREVLWSVANGSEPPLEWLAKTDGEGRIALDDGPLQTTTSGFVRCEGRWRRFLLQRVVRDEDLGNITVTWRTLDGQVVDGQRAPCAGVRVVACEQDPVAPASPPYWVTYTNHGGRFRFPSLPRCAFRVQVEAGIRGMAQADVAPHEERCQLQLGTGMSVEVQVDDAGGRGAPGCWVVLTRWAGHRDPEPQRPSRNHDSVFGVTDENGFVRFEGLPHREWYAVASRLREGQRETGYSDVSDREGVTVRLRSGNR